MGSIINLSTKPRKAHYSGETHYRTYKSLRFVHLFLRSSPFYPALKILCFRMLFNRLGTSQVPLPLGTPATPSNTWFLAHTRLSIPNCILIGSAVFFTAYTYTLQCVATDPHPPSKYATYCYRRSSVVCRFV